MRLGGRVGNLGMRLGGQVGNEAKMEDCRKL